MHICNIWGPHDYYCIGTQMPVVWCECGRCSVDPEIARLEQEGLVTPVWCL
jgi:hypothetical protein